MFIENNFITTPNIFNNNMEEKLMSLFFLMQGHVPIGLMDSFLENFILNDTSISVPTTNGLYDKYQQVFDIFNIKTNTKIIKTEYEYLWTYPIKLNVVYGDFIVELCVFLLNNVPFKILAEQDQKCIKELILYQLYINFQNASSNIVNKEKILECLKKVNLSTYTKAAESAIKICEKNLSNYLVMEIITRYLHATENSTHYILKNIAFEIKLLRLQLRYRKKSIKELLSNTEKLLDKINSTNLKDNDYKNKLIVEIRKFRYNLFTKILQYKNALSEINSALLIFENDYLLLHYHAICFKELYGWGKAAKSYNCAIKKFVDKTEEKYFLKACFHNNNAADLIKKNVEQALKHLRIAKKNAICTSDSELPLWIDIGILHYKLIKISMKQEKIPKKFYDDMREYRRISDYNAYYTDIARTYNIEGITYLYNNQIENAQLCFNKAFNFSTSDSFSFMQLIANTNFLLCTKQSSEFTNVWEFQKKVLLANREFIIQKLKNRTDIKCEPNFAIVICSIVVAQKYNLETDFDLLIKAYESIIPNFCFNTPILLEEQISQLFFYNGNVAIQF